MFRTQIAYSECNQVIRLKGQLTERGHFGAGIRSIMVTSKNVLGFVFCYELLSFILYRAYSKVERKKPERK